MAQTGERARSGSGSATPANQAPGAPAADTAPKRRFDFSRLLAPRATTSRSDSKQAPPERSRLSKVLFAWLLLFLGSQLLLTVIAIIASALHVNLDVPIIGRRDVTFLSGITYYLVIYVILLIGIYRVLLRLGWIPRDLFNPRPQPAAPRQATGTRPVPLAPGQPRTRAARREAARTAAAAPPPSAKTKKAAKAPPEPEPARKPTRPAGAHDDAYERVKARQRLQRRREAKR